jgi:uncharacterized protein (TIGR01777 family)
MKVLLAGGSGFLGRPLAARLALARHEVVILTRNDVIGRPIEGLRYVTWKPDGTIPIAGRAAVPAGVRARFGDWTNEVADAEAIINLAGENLADERWSASRKAALRASRKQSTESLVTALRHSGARPSVFLQASAIGYYGTSSEGTLDESSPPGSDFLASLCIEWEAAGQAAAAMASRMVFVRTGIVLAADGGALPKLGMPYKAYIGGPIGTGKQVMSWINRDDWLSMMTWAIENPDVSGPLNATAPKPVANADFARALGRALHRPAWVSAPAWAVRAVAGEMADITVLSGQRVMPRKALDLKFGFRYPDIDRALAAIYG